MERRRHFCRCGQALRVMLIFILVAIGPVVIIFAFLSSLQAVLWEVMLLEAQSKGYFALFYYSRVVCKTVRLGWQL